MNEYLNHRLGDLEPLARLASRRLLEVLAQEAFQDAPSKERTEARKLLHKTVLPEFKKITVDHRFHVETPQKAISADDWSSRYDPSNVQDAEIVDDE